MTILLATFAVLMRTLKLHYANTMLNGLWTFALILNIKFIYNVWKIEIYCSLIESLENPRNCK